MRLPLLIAGLAVSLVGYIWMLVTMATESPIWLLCGILLSPSILIFTIVHWRVARAPFLMHLLGSALLIFAAFAT